jgi:hypothetical protein
MYSLVYGKSTLVLNFEPGYCSECSHNLERLGVRILVFSEYTNTETA